MSAAEIIKQIETLPREERRRVFDFLKEADAVEATEIRFAPDAQTQAASAAVIQQYPEVFKRLAE